MEENNKNTEMVVRAEDYGITKEKSNELTSGLEIVRQERDVLIQEFEQVSKLEMTLENLETFKELRLRIVKNRTQGINKWHKKNKEFFLTGGKFVDAIKNKENFINEQMEEHLMNAEKHFENLEKQRLEDLQNERVLKIQDYLEDAHERDLSSMDADVWESFLYSKKKIHKEKIEAEKKAKKAAADKAKKEKAEQLRIKKENARLKAEADARAEKERLEREKRQSRTGELQPYIQFIRDYNSLIEMEDSEYEKELADIKKGADEHWKFEAEKKAKEDKEKAEKEKIRIQAEKKAAKLEAELKAQREQAEREAKAKKDAEEKAALEEKQRIENDLKKGDEEFKNELISDLQALTEKFTFKSEANKKMYSDVKTLIGRTINHINPK